MKLSQKQIDIAVRFWGDVLAAPIFDNGDPSPHSAVGMMLAELARNTPTLQQIEDFKESLRKILSVKDVFNSIGVDYHPCQILKEALNSAGIKDSGSSLPWKTDMFFFRNGKVKVSMGYGAPEKEITKT